jgi:uncharacterized protein (TIGR00290 family)
MRADGQAAVLLAWSGGKDSALALDALRTEGVPVAGLITTVTAGYERISMHGVRRTLLAAQADAVGLPLIEARIPARASNAAYETAFADALAPVRARGVTRVAFGDLFLADVRAYRERQLAALGMQPVFPLWLRDTAALARDFIARGFEAVLVCADPTKIDPSCAGRRFDTDLLRDLPAGADPCGENGEFHTFVFNGPGFARRVAIRIGPAVERDGFVFCDLAPGIQPDAPDPPVP